MSGDETLSFGIAPQHGYWNYQYQLTKYFCKYYIHSCIHTLLFAVYLIISTATNSIKIMSNLSPNQRKYSFISHFSIKFQDVQTNRPGLQ